MKTFLSKARNQIEGAIPTNNDLHYYVGAEIENIAFASYLFAIEDENNYQMVCILAFPSNFDLNVFIKEEIRKLRDILMENDSLIIIIYEDQAKGTRNCLGDFLSEELYLFNRNYIVLPSYNEANFKTTINGINYNTISKTLKYILNRQVQFIAPSIGLNQVNIEILSDACPSCKKEIKIVTGIVFPDTISQSWDNEKWKYYNSLIPVSCLNDKYVVNINLSLEGFFKKDHLITPIVIKDGTEKDSIVAEAICPCCNSVISSYCIDDLRMKFLHDMNSRLNCQLDYKTIVLDADQKLLNLLADSLELNTHSCFAGWRKINSKK